MFEIIKTIFGIVGVIVIVLFAVKGIKLIVEFLFD